MGMEARTRTTIVASRGTYAKLHFTCVCVPGKKANSGPYLQMHCTKMFLKSIPRFKAGLNTGLEFFIFSTIYF